MAHSKGHRPWRTEESVRHHAPAVAALLAELDGSSYENHLAWLHQDFDRLEAGDRNLVCVSAVAGEHVVGWGRAKFMDPSSYADGHNVDAGWYLTGLVVAPAYRRQGIGRALVAARIAAAATLGIDRLMYMTNADNHPSLRLHASLGFTERSRDFVFPGMSFPRGGVLCELAVLPSRATGAWLAPR